MISRQSFRLSQLKQMVGIHLRLPMAVVKESIGVVLEVIAGQQQSTLEHQLNPVVQHVAGEKLLPVKTIWLLPTPR